MHIFNKKNVLLILIVIIIIISIGYLKKEIVYFNSNDEYLNNKNKIINKYNLNSNFIINIKINNILGSYNHLNKTFYFSSDEFEIKKIEVISPYSTNYILNKIDDNNYKILVYSEKYYNEFNISIIKIPIINISTIMDINDKKKNFETTSIINEEKSNDIMDVYINLYDNNFIENNKIYNTISSQGTINIRGATSRLFEKKSYKIITKQSKKILNLDNDNDWVLDALYADKSKIRNKLSSDIWNMINNNQKTKNNLNGNFIEVFMDNEYLGLYVIKNNIDKNNLNIYRDGLIIKSIDHINNQYINKLIYNNFNVNTDGTFINLEIKYYNSNSFKMFIKKLREYYLYGKKFKIIKNNFDIDNYVNYNVFLALIMGVDNVTKNQYYSLQTQNSKILITPWDLDLTWALDYNSQTKLYTQEKYNSYCDKNWLDNAILHGNAPEINKLIIERYWELRKDVITMDTINNYLDSYKELLVSSGAAKRDSDRWYYYDIEQEIEKIRTWANNRITFLDEYFKI